MPKTTVINGTDEPLTLQEQNTGILTFLKKLQPKESYQIVVDIDATATWREYWCGVKADDPESGVVLSSDHCEDLKEVTIIKMGTEPNISFSYKGVNRESGKTKTEKAKILEETSNCESETAKGYVETAKGDVETDKHGGPLSCLLRFFRKPEKGSSSKSQPGNSGCSSP